MVLDSELLKILVCPDCKTPVKPASDSLVCTNAQCRRQYPVKDNIPVMLIDESVVLAAEEHSRLLQD